MDLQYTRISHMFVSIIKDGKSVRSINDFPQLFTVLLLVKRTVNSGCGSGNDLNTSKEEIDS
jgi:hypothetical protein